MIFRYKFLFVRGAVITEEVFFEEGIFTKARIGRHLSVPLGPPPIEGRPSLKPLDRTHHSNVYCTERVLVEIY